MFLYRTNGPLRVQTPLSVQSFHGVASSLALEEFTQVSIWHINAGRLNRVEHSTDKYCRVLISLITLMEMPRRQGHFFLDFQPCVDNPIYTYLRLNRNYLARKNKYSITTQHFIYWEIYIRLCLHFLYQASPYLILTHDFSFPIELLKYRCPKQFLFSHSHLFFIPAWHHRRRAIVLDSLYYSLRGFFCDLGYLSSPFSPSSSLQPSDSTLDSLNFSFARF